MNSNDTSPAGIDGQAVPSNQPYNQENSQTSSSAAATEAGEIKKTAPSSTPRPKTDKEPNKAKIGTASGKPAASRRNSSAGSGTKTAGVRGKIVNSAQAEPSQTSEEASLPPASAKRSPRAGRGKSAAASSVREEERSLSFKQPDGRPNEQAGERATEAPFDLRQATEFWPEAWPDEAAEPIIDERRRDPDAGLDDPVALSRPAVGMTGIARAEMPDLHFPFPPDIHNEQTDLIKLPDEPAQVEELSTDLARPGRKNVSRRPTNDLAEEPADNDYAFAEQDNFLEEAEDEPGNDKKFKTQNKTQSVPGKSAKKRKMFISVLPGEQVEVAVTEENQVQEYYVQMLHQVKTKGNIYKGVIHNVDANLQAAFISYGAYKNGFLQIDEVHPDYYLAPYDVSKGKKYPLIQKVLKAGQEVLVQVVKEPTGGKGAFLSTYLSIPGRFLVLTPGRTQFGVSRKVEDEADRDRLRDLLDSLPTQDGLGVIVRTASLSASKTSMLKDLQVLKRQWKEVRARGTTEPAPCLVYEEPSLASRAVRDYLSDDIAEIWVDDEETAKEIKDTVALIFPRRASGNLIKLHNSGQRVMWEAFDIQRQIDQIYSREVVLPSGGRLVFDQTEALMAIDINSGKIAGRNNFESMALRTNIEAAQVIACQLRLRDIGGQIVIDFIEMRERNHWRELEKVIRNAMKSDRARYDVAKVSSFGLMEVVRQRLGSSSISVTMEACPCCRGTGLRRNMEWQALHTLRDLQYLALHKSGNEKIVSYETEPEIALYLLNNKRAALSALEERYDVAVEIKYR